MTLAVLLRKRFARRLAEGYELIFAAETSFLRVTSIRQGFAGGGFDGGPGLPKLLATAAGIPGRSLDPARRRALPRLHLDAEGADPAPSGS